MTAVVAVLIASGMVTRYNPGVMQEVVANRISWGHLPAGTNPADCVALLDCEQIGNRVWVEVDSVIYGPYTVADCAAAQDIARLAHLRFAVDVSWEIAQEMGVVVGPLRGARVWDSFPVTGEFE